MTIPQEIPPTQMLRRDQIAPSPLNVRKTFDAEAIKELAESIREHGFKPAGALLVRRVPEELRVEMTPLGDFIVQRREPQAVPIPAEEGWFTLHTCNSEDEACQKLVDSARFEIIWGERRWRAAGILGLEYVPAVVEEHTDLEALELNLIENLQRADLNPIEQANGFRSLLNEKSPDGTPHHTPQSIAKRLGCTEKYVGDFLSLTRLVGTSAEQALIAGTLPEYHAVLISRLATLEIREEVTQKVLRNPYGPSPMPRPQLENLIRDDYQKQLRGAKFDSRDPDLLPIKHDEAGNRISGGSCADCPLNTKNLTGDKHHWQCTNTHCYKAKETAAYEKWRVESAAASEGRTALPSEENAQLWNFNETTLTPSAAAKYILLEEKPVLQDLRPGVDDPQPWKKLLEGQNVPIVLAQDGHGKERHLFARAVAISAAQQNGHEICRTAVKVKKKDEADLRAAVEAERIAKEREGIVLGEQDSALRDKLRTHGDFELKSEAAFLLIIQCLVTALAEGALASRAAENRGWTNEEKLGAEDYLLKYAKRLPGTQRMALLLELVVALREPTDKWRQAWAKELGVDLKSIRKACETRFAEADKSAAEKKNIAEGLYWPSKHDSVEDFTWSAANVCTNPDTCEVGLPAPEKATIVIKVARSEKGWHVGRDIKFQSQGASCGASKTTTAYSSRELAVRAGLLDAQEHLKNSGLAATLARIKEYLALLGTSKKAQRKTPEEELSVKAGVKPPRKVKVTPKPRKAKA